MSRLDLHEVLDLDPTADPSVWRGHSPAQHRTPWVFGGQVVAQALAAAGIGVEPDRAAHSLHAYFLRRGDVQAPIDYAVDHLRDGASFSTRTVTAHQDDGAILSMTASFQRPMAGVAHQVPELDVPDPERLPSAHEVFDGADGFGPGWWQRNFADRFPVDIRFVGTPTKIAVSGGRPAGAHSTIWMRVSEPLTGDAHEHRCALAYLSDLFLLASALPPHGYAWGHQDGLFLASLDHSVWFHTDLRVDDWLLYDVEGYWADGGRALSRGYFYDVNRRLVASVVQEGVVRIGPAGADQGAVQSAVRTAAWGATPADPGPPAASMPANATIIGRR